jgi:transketolase
LHLKECARLSDPAPARSQRNEQDDVLPWSPADARAVDLIRVLAMDAVQKAGSGHPGTAMTARGGYVLAEAVRGDGEAGGEPDVILIGTGSEVQIALAAREALQQDGIAARAVSMPCAEWFAAQDASYQQEVLPARVRARVSVEAGIALGWRGFVGDAGECVGLEHFGESADYQTLYREFGITAEHVVTAAKASVARVRAR